MNEFNIYFKINHLIIFLLCFEYSNLSVCTTDCRVNDFSSSQCTGHWVYNIYDYTDSNGVIHYKDVYHDCPDDCKPKYNTDYCYHCSSVSDIYYTIDSSGKCYTYECIGEYIIAATYECTSTFPSNYYQLGDFYYKYKPSNTNCRSDKYCECQSYFYITIEYGKKLYYCYSSANDIEPSYKFCNPITRECFKGGCPEELRIKKVDGIADNVYRCSDSCKSNEWYIAYLNTDNHITEYCANKCGDKSEYSSYKYEYRLNGIKQCVNSCPSHTYIKDYSCVSVDDCDYYSNVPNLKCYTTCLDHNSYNFHNYESKECISGCTEGEYKYANNYICYRKIECNFIDTSTSPYYTCILSDSCDISSQVNTFHDIDSKLCINKCGLDNEINIYYADDGDTCYSSCSEIPNNYIYEQIGDDNSPKKCYKLKPTSDCDVYYQKVDLVKKCSTKYNCIHNVKYKYIYLDECLPSCNGYYKLEEYVEKEGTKYVNYTRCFKTLEEALSSPYNIHFCDTFEKKCFIEYPKVNRYFINTTFDGYTDKYQIVKACQYYYYNKTGSSTDISANKNWCVNTCKEVGHFFVIGSRKCLVTCQEIRKYYYYPVTNECIDTCEYKPDMPFSYQIKEGVPESCLDECDDGRGLYYSYNSHICMEKCNDDNSDNLYHALGKYVCYPSCLDIPDGPYIYEWRNFICSIEEPASLRNCHLRYMKKYGVIKCAEPIDCYMIFFIIH